MINVAFLFDKSNPWIFKHFKNFNFHSNKFRFHFFYDYKKVKKFDIVFVLGYTKILSKNFLKKNNLNLVIHESDLPNGKGFAPIQWQILKGKKNITFSLLEMAESFDSGDIFLQKKLKLNGHELNQEIRNLQAKLTIKIIKLFLKKYPKILLFKTKQQGKSTFFKKRSVKDSELDINKSIKDQFNLLRVVDNENYPAFIKFKKRKYIIKIFNA